MAAVVVSNLEGTSAEIRAAYDLAPTFGPGDLRAVSDFYTRADAALDAADAEGEGLEESLAPGKDAGKEGGEEAAAEAAEAAAAAAAGRCRIWWGVSHPAHFDTSSKAPSALSISTHSKTT